jgi:hypothetical protein
VPGNLGRAGLVAFAGTEGPSSCHDAAPHAGTDIDGRPWPQLTGNPYLRGSKKTVRTSIICRACTWKDTGTVKGYNVIQNNHGSPVTINWEFGFSFAGGAPTGIVTIGDDVIATGKSQRRTGFPGICGLHARLVVRIQDTSGWGPWNYDSERSFC